MTTATVARVSGNTDPEVNERIRTRMEQSVLFYGAKDTPTIDRRLAELEQEWDIERVIETEAPVMALAGMFLGTTVDKKWYALTGMVGGMVLLHALQGWYPLLPLLRRFGCRTREEIGQEKMALKAMRGDFEGAGNEGDAAARADAALRAVRK